MDQETILLLQSIMTDEGKQKRLAEITAAMDALKAEGDKVAAHRAQAEATLQQAAVEHQAGLDAKAEAQRVLEGHAEKERALGAVSDALVDEKRRFEEVRQAVDADHHAREAKVSEREKLATAKEAELVDREHEVGLREHDVANREQALVIKHDRLNKAMALNDAEADAA